MNKKFINVLTIVVAGSVVGLTLFAVGDEPSADGDVQLSPKEMELWEKESQISEALRSIRETHADDSEKLHDAKVAYIEANKELTDSIELLRREITAGKERIPAPPEPEVVLERTEFQSDEEWLLYSARKEVSDGLNEIRTLHAEDSEKLHDAKVRFAEENKELLESIRLLEQELGMPTVEPREPNVVRVRADFPSDEHWQLYQLESEVSEELQKIRETHRDDPLKLHEAKILYRGSHNELFDSIKQLHDKIQTTVE